jgi:hypothetical protein
MDLPERLDRDGVFTERDVVDKRWLDLLRPHFADVSGRPGSRGFQLTRDVETLVGPGGALGELARRCAGKVMRPVRVLFFDKTPEANWAIPWHQDRTIAVKARADVDGFGPWTTKDGIVHVEPPVDLLRNMLTLRLFVDDCDEANGPLMIAIASHRQGRLPAARLSELVWRSDIYAGTGRAGDVLVMKTLAIHASKAAVLPAHRRVLHVDYTADDLPPPLQWHLA